MSLVLEVGVDGVGDLSLATFFVVAFLAVRGGASSMLLPALAAAAVDRVTVVPLRWRRL
jgi:hypothetical protein